MPLRYLQQIAEQMTLGVTRSWCVNKACGQAAVPFACCKEKELAGRFAEAADLGVFQMQPKLMVMLLQQSVQLPNGSPDAHCAVVLQQAAACHEKCSWTACAQALAAACDLDGPSNCSAATAAQMCSLIWSSAGA